MIILKYQKVYLLILSPSIILITNFSVSSINMSVNVSG